MYVNYMQNNWAWWCSSAEFTYNNHISEVTKCTSFFVNSEQHSHMDTKSFNVDITLWEQDQAQQQIALNFATKMNLINDTLQIKWLELRLCMKNSQTAVVITPQLSSKETWFDWMPET